MGSGAPPLRKLNDTDVSLGYRLALRRDCKSASNLFGGRLRCERTSLTCFELVKTAVVPQLICLSGKSVETCPALSPKIIHFAIC
jgi:hypothetical protein